MVDLDQTERVDRELNVVKRARFNQTIKVDKSNEVPETKFGVEPHTVKELPALPVRERQQDNMFLHQQLQDNMLDEEVVSFGQRAQHQQDQQQLQLRQHNIPHNPVSPKHRAIDVCQWAVDTRHQCKVNCSPEVPVSAVQPLTMSVTSKYDVCEQQASSPMVTHAIRVSRHRELLYQFIQVDWSLRIWIIPPVVLVLPMEVRLPVPRILYDPSANICHNWTMIIDSSLQMLTRLWIK